MIKHLRMVAPLAGALGLLLLGGCVGKVQGRVVEGPYPAVLIVDRDDARLAGEAAARGELGISAARIELVLDAGTLRARQIGLGQADADGRFSIDVDAFGAGFLEDDVQVLARRPGYGPTLETIRIPSSRKRLLIVMTPGSGGDRRSEHFLDETLRMGQPYMD